VKCPDRCWEHQHGRTQSDPSPDMGPSPLDEQAEIADDWTSERGQRGYAGPTYDEEGNYYGPGYSEDDLED
jgi:hypothetical protein